MAPKSMVQEVGGLRELKVVKSCSYGGEALPIHLFRHCAQCCRMYHLATMHSATDNFKEVFCFSLIWRHSVAYTSVQLVTCASLIKHLKGMSTVHLGLCKIFFFFFCLISDFLTLWHFWHCSWLSNDCLEHGALTPGLEKPSFWKNFCQVCKVYLVFGCYCTKKSGHQIKIWN